MLLVVLSVLVILLGCEKQEGRLTIAVGGAPEEVSYWEKLIEDFERESGIEVDLIRQPTDTDLRRQGLVVALSSKKPDPDVFLMDVAWLGQFISSGWLAELKGFDLEPFFPEVLKVDRMGGKLYALPVYVDCGVLYYRKDLLKEFGCRVPERWTELVDCSLKVQSAMKKRVGDFYGFVWQGAQYEGLVCTFLEFSASAGGSFEDLASKENIRALTFMKDLIHRYKISPPNTYTEMKEEEVRIYFQSGRALFERNWPYAWKLHNSPESPVKGKIGVSVLPKFEGGRHASCLGGWHIGISRYSDKKREALKLLKFIVSKEVQKRLALNLGWNPGRRDVYEDRELKERLPHLKAVREACSYAVSRPPLPYYTRFSEVLRKYVNAAIGGRMSPEEALKRANEEIEELERLYR